MDLVQENRKDNTEQKAFKAERNLFGNQKLLLKRLISDFDEHDLNST